MNIEVKRDKSKAFKATADTIEKVEELIKQSGKGPTEFFEDLVLDLSINSVVDPDNENISPGLRKHFQSDVQKLKNATNSIISIFTSQMENISVEKNQWQMTSDKQLGEKQVEIDKLLVQLADLKEQHNVSRHDVTELTKVNQTLIKEQEVLTKRTLDQEQLIQDRTEKIADLQERINKLNENVVDKDEKLKAIEPTKVELATVKQELQSMQQENKRLIEKHAEELVKKEETLLFDFKQEKYELEVILKDAFVLDQEILRNEVRRDTEKNTREFYLAELERKEAESKLREEEYKSQIKALQEQIQESSTTKKPPARKANTNKPD